jgi:hypothetical protein
VITLKNSTITISYDSEKLSAIKKYMSMRQLDFEDEVEKSVDAMYKKYIPANVREYIEMRLEDEPAEKSPRAKPKKKETVDNGISQC